VTETENRPPRRRKPPRLVEVVSVSRIAPRLVSVLVTGDSLEGFATAVPTSHMKVLLPPAGQELVLPKQGPDGPVYPDDAPRPVMRTYTPRRYDEPTRTLEIQFVLHGEGPASGWAERAAPGDKIAVAGPGGRFVLDETAPYWWIAADESAIPAVATLLEALPAGVTADVHIEVADASFESALDGVAESGAAESGAAESGAAESGAAESGAAESGAAESGAAESGAAKAVVTWHHRRSPDAFGAELEEAARAADLPAGARVWVACEASSMRGIRRYFTRDRGLAASSLVTRGYWRLGAANHPDHDYGED
jgi:NADPH-dependent ferric siderophore reductase